MMTDRQRHFHNFRTMRKAVAGMSKEERQARIRTARIPFIALGLFGILAMNPDIAKDIRRMSLEDKDHQDV